MHVQYNVASLRYPFAWRRVANSMFDESDFLRLLGSVLMISSGLGLSVLLTWHVIVVTTGLGTIDAMTYRRDNQNRAAAG